jgi:hypothetical protein
MKQRTLIGTRTIVICIVAVFIAMSLVITLIMNLRTSLPTTKHNYSTIPKKDDFEDAGFERDGKWYGLCKKNSVHSINDFRNTVSEDQVLKTHFADFKWEKAGMGKLEKSILAYVYFRKNGKIFRKAKPITLPAGDEYITDGNIRVRTNCCNDYTEKPVFDLQAGISKETPTSINKDQISSNSPMQAVTKHPSWIPLLWRSSGSKSTVIAWLNSTTNDPKIVPYTTPEQKHFEEPISVPEPNTILFLTVTLAALFVIYPLFHRPT